MLFFVFLFLKVLEPRIKDRVMEEGYKRTQEERNKMLREELVY